MDVLALLPPPLRNHLEAVLGCEHCLVSAADWEDFDHRARHRVFDLAVADPSLDIRSAIQLLERIRSDLPRLPLIVYTTLGPGTMTSAIRLARCGVEQVVLHRYDDQPARFRRLLEAVPGLVLGERMLYLIAEPLGRLPVVVSQALETMFKHPARFRSPEDLATAAGMNKRTLYRYLRRAGFPSPRALVIAARLIQAHAYLSDRGRTIKDVARQAGYRTPFLLNQQMREMTARTTEQAREELRGEDLVAILAQQVQRETRRPRDE